MFTVSASSAPAKDAYLSILVHYADQIYGKGSVMSKLLAAQAILESGLLGKPSILATKHNNLFGIKGKGTAGSVKLRTWEILNGKKVWVITAFAKNKTMYDSLLQYKNLMSKSRYQHVIEAKTFSDAADAVYKAGYATDPTYPKQLKSIYNTHLSKFYKE